MSTLFTPFTLGGVTLANRIVVAPMCQYSADEGRATAWHMMHLGGLASSGAAAVIIEATAVEPAGRITHGCLGLWDDATEAALRPVVDAVRRYTKTRLMIQIAHAGRKASSEPPWRGGQLIALANGGWQPVAPSVLPHKADETPPAALDAAGLRRVRDAFVDTARRAMRLGLEGIELHLAHGYLLHEFLSPISNQRSDEYGGSFVNRTRFPLEVFDAVRAVVPAGTPLGVKVSATDWVDGGWDVAQTIELAQTLKRRGLDWIDVSSGGVSMQQKIPLGPGYQVPLAQAVKEATGLATIAVGLITEPAQAEEIVASGKADLVALARGMLYDPRWGWHAAAALGGQVDAPPQYWRAPPRAHANLFKDLVFGMR